MASEAPKEKKVFVRDATGLVRSLSPFDLFNLSFGHIMPAVGIVFIVSTSPVAFPQSNMFLAFLLSIPLVGLGPALLYGMLGAAMPRTGGDYVYVSRVIHPALGFMTNWLFTVTVISFIAVAGVTFPSTALNVFVATIGQMTGNTSLVTNSAWFATQTGEMVTGTVLIVGISILMALGKAVWNFMKILFFIVMIGSIVNIIYLLSVGNTAFMTAWNSMFGSQITYNGVIQAAVSAGYKTGWTWGGTIGALVYAMGGLIGFNFAAYSGGEAKSSSRSVPIAIVGSLIIGAIFFAAWALGIYNAFGYDFFSAANYLANCGCSKIILPIPASVNSLFTILSQNGVTEILGALAFGLAWIWLTPTDFIPVVRNMFAWSFDRVGPERLADVNPRFGTPVKAVVLTAVIGEILLAFFVYYTGFPLAFANTTILLNLVFFITSFSGILLPYRAKAVFDQAPGWVKARVGGIPVITLVGIFSAIVEAILLYASFTNTIIGGSPSSYPVAIGLAVAGIVIFYVVRAYRKSQGISLDLVFKEIPPE